MAHLSKDNHALVMRLRRMVGQLQAVERSLLDGEDCAKVLLQSAAVRGAINGFIDELIEDHLRTHVSAPDLTETEREDGMQTVMAAIRRYAK